MHKLILFNTRCVSTAIVVTRTLPSVSLRAIRTLAVFFPCIRQGSEGGKHVTSLTCLRY